MRSSMMCVTLLAFIFLPSVACSQETFTYNRWESWNSFPEGAWTTFQVTLRGQFNKSTTEEHTYSISKKEAGKIVVNIRMSETFEQREEIEKTDPPASPCTSCKKEHVKDLGHPGEDRDR